MFEADISCNEKLLSITENYVKSCQMFCSIKDWIQTGEVNHPSDNGLFVSNDIQGDESKPTSIVNTYTEESSVFSYVL